MAKNMSKNVTNEWTWLSDYVAATIQWTVNCPTDRRCEVGMGMKIFGQPRGEKIGFSGARKFTTLGLGAIHVRVTDGQGTCPVRLDEGDVGLINLPNVPFP